MPNPQDKVNEQRLLESQIAEERRREDEAVKPDHPETPEAVEAVVRQMAILTTYQNDPESDPLSPDEYAASLLAAAAPVIREQEQERVLAKIEERFVDGDLPERIERAVRADECQRVREALTGERARGALYDAHMHYQSLAPEEQSEDGWVLALTQAILHTLEGER